MQKITPFLWYVTDALAVAKYYKDIFAADAIIEDEQKYENTPPGTTHIVIMTIRGLKIGLMAAGKHHEFNDSISFEITCKDQTEIDYFWQAFTTNGGAESECGWCQDKYGVRWQIVPENIAELIDTPGGMQAMLAMKKLDINTLRQANNIGKKSNAIS